MSTCKRSWLLQSYYSSAWPWHVSQPCANTLESYFFMHVPWIHMTTMQGKIHVECRGSHSECVLTLPCMRRRMVRVTLSPPSDWTLVGSILVVLGGVTGVCGPQEGEGCDGATASQSPGETTMDERLGLGPTRLLSPGVSIWIINILAFILHSTWNPVITISLIAWKFPFILWDYSSSFTNLLFNTRVST